MRLLFVGQGVEFARPPETGRRQEWLVERVAGAEQAALRLGRGGVDLVVAAATAEFETGVPLWDWLRREFPAIPRISLVAPEDSQRAARLFGRVHQQLAVPIDPDALQFAVERALLVFELVREPALRELLAGIDSLPSLPAVYRGILAELNTKDPSLQRVGEQVAQDVAICARVLQVANSALYGLHHEISDPIRATVHIGLESTKALALSIGLMAEFEGPTLPAGFLDEFMHHSLNVGIFAKAIGQAEGLDEAACDTTLCAGLLHDLGRLFLAARLPREFEAVRRFHERKGSSMYRAEQEVLGTTHAELGAYLIGLWGLPDDVLFGVRHHHAPARAARKDFSPALAVHIADRMHHALRAGWPPEAATEVDLAELERLEMGALLPTWGRICEAAELS